jgi:diadenosine tetraphosphatase ApaH/serine/threonine PP2A family protein phosphatase
VINVGSVGQPRDGDPRASYVIIHGPGEGPGNGSGTDLGSIEFVRVPYNIDVTANKIRAIPELSDWLGERLYDGR